MSVVPYLTIAGGRGAEAADFYIKLFDAKETRRMVAEDGKRIMHCSFDFRGGSVFLSDDFMNQGGKPALSSVFVGMDRAKDVDALVAKAKSMGATVTQEPQDMFWGDRFAMFTDPYGHVWQTGAAKDS
ncbi:MAG: VOC family protein [Alphaproteobacteria bacterium]|nr:VOC family protein [Alphaproteobacteria bacterium]